MPRYFFDVTDGRGFHPDDFGDEFDSIQEAGQQCLALLSAYTVEGLPNGDQHVMTCEVRDETGRTVYRGKVTYEGAPKAQ